MKLMSEGLTFIVVALCAITMEFAILVAAASSVTVPTLHGQRASFAPSVRSWCWTPPARPR